MSVFLFGFLCLLLEVMSLDSTKKTQAINIVFWAFVPLCMVFTFQLFVYIRTIWWKICTHLPKNNPRVCMYFYLRQQSINIDKKQGVFINHVDKVGKGVYQFSILLHKPYQVNLSTKGEGVKNDQKSVHMLYK